MYINICTIYDLSLFYQPHFSGSPRHILAMSSRVKVNRSSPFWAMLVDHHKSCHLVDLQMVAAQMATRTYWNKYEKMTFILCMHLVGFRETVYDDI